MNRVFIRAVRKAQNKFGGRDGMFNTASYQSARGGIGEMQAQEELHSLRGAFRLTGGSHWCYRPTLRESFLNVMRPFLVAVMVTGCSAAQPVTKDATCSPQAQSWWAREMAEQCGLKKAEDCPASKAIDAEFLERECIECAQNAGEAEECTKP